MEWNDGAIAIIFLMIFIPVVLVYIIVKMIVRYSPSLLSVIKKQKGERPVVYIIIEIGIGILSVGVTVAIFGLINFLNHGQGVLNIWRD